jgi:acetyl esterase/lipase
VLGSSSGGHNALLLDMRVRDARYSAIPLPEAPKLDAAPLYVATRAPISDPFARFMVAEKIKREELVKASKTYFQPWESIHEGNPQEILDRREKTGLRPLLIMQGGADDHMLPANQKKFAAAYRAAGGDVQFELFEGGEHEWTAQSGPLTGRAHETVKAFIARSLAGSLRLAV